MAVVAWQWCGHHRRCPCARSGWHTFMFKAGENGGGAYFCDDFYCVLEWVNEYCSFSCCCLENPSKKKKHIKSWSTIAESYASFSLLFSRFILVGFANKNKTWEGSTRKFSMVWLVWKQKSEGLTIWPCCAKWQSVRRWTVLFDCLCVVTCIAIRVATISMLFHPKCSSSMLLQSIKKCVFTRSSLVKFEDSSKARQKKENKTFPRETPTIPTKVASKVSGNKTKQFLLLQGFHGKWVDHYPYPFFFLWRIVSFFFGHESPIRVN